MISISSCAPFSVDLLNLLKWRSQKEKLGTILPALMKVNGQEIVKVVLNLYYFIVI